MERALQADERPQEPCGEVMVRQAAQVLIQHIPSLHPLSCKVRHHGLIRALDSLQQPDLGDFGKGAEPAGLELSFLPRLLLQLRQAPCPELVCTQCRGPSHNKAVSLLA